MEPQLCLSSILAMDRNRLIGANNQLPWRLPADLAYFKRVTMDHPVLMGRKTYESIGRPLPGRRNLVLTRSREFAAEGIEVFHSPEEVMRELREEQEVFNIGGAELYKLLLPQTRKLYITWIDHEFEGDTHFPEISEEEWIMVRNEKGERSERNPYDYYFRLYERRSPLNNP